MLKPVPSSSEDPLTRSALGIDKNAYANTSFELLSFRSDRQLAVADLSSVTRSYRNVWQCSQAACSQRCAANSIVAYRLWQCH